MLAMRCTEGCAAVISIPNPAANVWKVNLASINNDTYTYPDAAGSFSPASFVVETFLDDNASNLGAPVSSLIFSTGTNLLVSSAYSRAATVFGVNTFYRNGTTDTFVSRGAFYDNAVPGGDNYVGIEIADAGGRQHYGWLQYTFAGYSNGNTAVVFDGGYMNDVAGIGVVAGVVPEPPAMVFATVGACILAGRRWQRWVG